MPSVRSELHKKTQNAILQHAFLRWESAVVVAGTILLMGFLPRPFSWWPLWGWPALGLVGLAAVAYSSLTDAETSARLLKELLRQQFDLGKVSDPDLRQDVEAALEYQRQIEANVRGQRPGVLRDRLEDTADQLSEWVSSIYRLTVRLDAYRGDTLLADDREKVPRDLETLAARHESETDPAVQRGLDDVLEGKRRQWQTLQALDVRMKQAELQLEQSLTALATVYGQVQLIDAQAVDSGRADRVTTDIVEQVQRLNDLVSSINEVYDYHTPGVG